MVNKKSWLGILVIVLVFGMTVVGNLEAQTDINLNGVWINTNMGEWKLQNGNFEISGFSEMSFKGTYVTNNGIMSFKATQIFFSNPPAEFGVEKKWYTLNELFIAMKPAALKEGIPENEIYVMISSLFSLLPDFPYSVDKSTLILTNKDNRGKTNVVTFIKK